MKMSKDKMIAKYNCVECADKKRRKQCYETGVCPYANDFEPEEEKPPREYKRRVRCVETGVIYESVSAAERAFGLKKGCLSGYIGNPIRAINGYHFANA